LIGAFKTVSTRRVNDIRSTRAQDYGDCERVIRISVSSHSSLHRQ
jgi:hypothetical protein